MKQHTWKIYEEDGGSIGINEFIKCDECGAHAGSPTWVMKPFLPGPALRLSESCDEAKVTIEAWHQECRKAAQEAIKYWSKIDPSFTKAPLTHFLGWSIEEYDNYVLTGSTPYSCKVRFHAYEAFKCNHGCPSCCERIKDVE